MVIAGVGRIKEHTVKFKSSIGYLIVGYGMSSELKNVLYKQAEDDYKIECKEIEEGLERYKSHLIKIVKAGKWDFPISIEGWETHREQEERDLNLLERSRLIKSEMKYTEHNAYREYRVTEKGAELQGN